MYIIGVTFFGVMGMFPRMLISSIDPTATLTAFNASSSELTLKIMLGVALVMVPIVLLYQFWVYRLFSHSLSAEDLKDEHAYQQRRSVRLIEPGRQACPVRRAFFMPAAGIGG